jgi:ribosomal subunit interface protein
MHLKVRGLNLRVRQELRTSVERRLWFALGRFARRIGRVTVELMEEEGPDRARVKRCRVIVNFVRSSQFCVEETGTDLVAVVERATHRVGQQVRREIERQRDESERSATETQPLRAPVDWRCPR